MGTSRLIATMVTAVLSPGVSVPADLQAGRSAAEAKCLPCHGARDWEGEDATSLEELIGDIVAHKVKHRTVLELSPAEIANIAAYWDDSSNR